MGKKTLILTEDQLKGVLDNLLNEQVYTDFDKTYDYKFDGKMWYTTRKGQNKWISLQGRPDAIKKLNSKYGKSTPTTQTTQPTKRKQVTPTEVSEFPIKNEAEGNAFRTWFIQNYPTQAKKIDLSPTGSFNNSYIKNAYNLKLSDGSTAGQAYTKGLGTEKKEDFEESGFKSFLMKVLPSNVVQMLYPTNLSNKSITRRQKTELGNAIKRSMKRMNTNKSGNVTYDDWGPEYVEWFKNDQPVPKKDLFTRSITDPKFQIATTVGQGMWKNMGDKVIYQDEYDWNKSGAGYSRYKEAVGVDTTDLNYYQAIRKLQKEGGLDLYRAIRELQHRESPVVTKNTASPKMVFTFDKNEFWGQPESTPPQT